MVAAIVPPPLTEQEYLARQRQGRRLRWWVRGGLLALTLVPVAVFAVALRLDPYQEGRLWLEETHTQLGLPPCTFRVATGWPCPACGMTSSFALFVRGDLWHSMQANVAGTLLALVALLFIPWALVTALRGRLLGFRSWETALVRVITLFMALMFGRWLTLAMLKWWS